MPQGTRRRLSRQDWVRSGLAALSEAGPDAVAVEPLAARLGATKGSGYWHWSSRAELLAAVLDAWASVATDQVVDTLERGGGTAAQRLSRLLVLVTEHVQERPGELVTLTHTDPVVRAVVERVTDRRIGYVQRLLAETGFDEAESRRRAVLAHASYLGYAQLAAVTPQALPAAGTDRQALQQSLFRMVTGQS